MSKFNENEWRNRVSKERREFYINILGGVCKICGSEDNLEFDHIDRNNKSFQISNGWLRRINVIETELAKCQLLCKPCHINKTIRERNQVRHKYPEGHGSLSTYTNKRCRCSLCIKSHNNYMAEYMRKRRLNRS